MVNQWKRQDGDVLYGNDGILGAISDAVKAVELENSPAKAAQDTEASEEGTTNATPAREYPNGSGSTTSRGGGAGGDSGPASSPLGGRSGSAARAALFEPKGRYGTPVGGPRS